MKKYGIFLLAFIFSFVAIGALDCGCAFALEKIQVEEAMAMEHDCHGNAEKKEAKGEELCCSGCTYASATRHESTSEIKPQGSPSFQKTEPGFVTFTSSSNINILSQKLSLLPMLDRRSASIPHLSNEIFLLVESFLI